MDLLDNIVQPYAWGSRTAIAELQGRPPSQKPEAELWLGAHPVAPSKSLRGGQWLPLPERIAANPAAELGSDIAARYGRLPFLLKVLAAAEPLSMQAHPTLEQAKAGFAREEALGIARDAPNRNYRDDNHKPEILVALTEFDALCGFRPVEQTRALLEQLHSSELVAPRRMLAEWPNETGTHALFYGLMSMPADERAAVVADVLQACERHVEQNGRFAAECRWALTLGRRYPGDVGAVTSLLLNLVHLQPGEGIYLPAGNLHSYLGGVGVELMAASDNVLRGGLTPKHIDVQELISVLDYRPTVAPVVRASREGDEWVYPTPADEFRLSRIELDGQRAVTLSRRGPEVLLCVAGEILADGLTLRKGASAFVPASDGPYQLRGQGTVFRATPR